MLFISPPTRLFYSSPSVIYIVSAHPLPVLNRTWRCHLLPGQFIVHWVRWWIWGSIWLQLSVYSLRLAACLQVWKKLRPLFLPKPSHMPEPPPAPAPEPDAAGIEISLFSVNWPLWPNGWVPHAAPDVCDEHQKQKMLVVKMATNELVDLLWYEKNGTEIMLV